MILSFMILSSRPGQNPDRIMKGQNHGDRSGDWIVRAPGISSPLANDFDGCSAARKKDFLCVLRASAVKAILVAVLPRCGRNSRFRSADILVGFGVDPSEEADKNVGAPIHRFFNGSPIT
jgi:hypothetical protein